MEEEGTVIEILDNMAKVQVEPKVACRGCRFCNLGTGGIKIALVENPIGAEKGDKVVFEIPSTDLLKAASILYLVPVILLISGLIIGDKISSHIGFEEIREGMAIISGIIFLLMGYLSIYYYHRWIKRGNRFRPRITQNKRVSKWKSLRPVANNCKPTSALLLLPNSIKINKPERGKANESVYKLVW